jgi:hypothetical protein
MHAFFKNTQNAEFIRLNFALINEMHQNLIDFLAKKAQKSPN